jgi:hypothetical protein
MLQEDFLRHRNSIRVKRIITLYFWVKSGDVKKTAGKPKSAATDPLLLTTL